MLLLPTRDEARGPPPVWQHGFENWRPAKRKGDEKRAHRGSTMISPMVGTSAFSDRTRFSVSTGQKSGSLVSAAHFASAARFQLPRINSPGTRPPSIYAGIPLGALRGEISWSDGSYTF